MSSLTREKVEEICQHIRVNPDTHFGQKYWQCRRACCIQIQQKADRWETRFLAIAKFRVFLLNGKSISSLKVELSFNVLALRNLELLQKEQALQIGWEDRPGGTKSTAPTTIVHLFVRMPDGGKTRELLIELLSTLKHYFPEIQKSLPKIFNSLGPPSLLAEFSLLPTSTPELPCHNFRRSYVAYCDWMEQPFRDEVIWDIERIYFFNCLHELNLNDFSHLTLKDQQALIGSIQFSNFFTGVCADSLRLQPEHIDALILLIRRSHSLKSLQFDRCILPKDFLQQLATALVLNMNLPLERLRLAGIPLDDRKGLSMLANILPQLSTLHSLSLSDCSLNEKAALALLNGLHHGIRMANESSKAEDGDSGQQSQSGPLQLKVLNLSGNPLGSGVDLAEQLANLLALNNGAIRLLDLSGTAIQLDRLWAALKLGGLGLEVLRLAGCHISHLSKKNHASGKDNAQVARELFANFKALKELNLTGTLLDVELLQGILKGLSNNLNLSISSLHLILDGCIVGQLPCIAALEQELAGCTAIRFISLRDNAIEHEAWRIFSQCALMSHLSELDIGGANFFGLKASKKYASMLENMLSNLVELVNEPWRLTRSKKMNPAIEGLSMADSRLGAHLSVLLNALGLSETLKKLDLSNCELGPGGARLLGKSLQLNQSLRHLSLDRNQIGTDGLVELARALQLNTTLLHIQLPLSDLTDAYTRSPADRCRLAVVIAEIEQALERNRQLALEGPTQTQLAVKTIHSLNNRCQNYEVNGENASESKKVAFHKISKLVAKIGEQEEQPNEEKQERTEEGERLAEQMAEQIELLAQRSSKEFLRKFTEILSSQEGVEIQDERQPIDSTKETDENRGKQLRQQLTAVIDKYTSEFAWQKLFSQMDGLLSAQESQNCFRIKQAKTTETTAKKGILVRTGNTPAAMLSHRPVSAMMVDEHLQNGSGQFPDLMSRSVIGNFTFNESNKMSDGEEEQQRKRTTDELSKLVHLAKRRPMPARLNRIKKAMADENSGVIIEEGKDNEEESESVPDPSNSSRAIVGSSDSSSTSSNNLECFLEQSPLMQQQRKYQKKEMVEEEEEQLTTKTTGSPASSPPPIPKKGTREATPPKLPPKPSPNSEDLRNRKTRVLPFEGQ